MLALAAFSCRQPEITESALDMANLDRTVAPGDDFYQYATGGWQAAHPLKPEYSRYGSFNVLSDDNEKRLKQLFESLGSASPVPGSEAQKIDDLYRMGLDSARLAAEGAEPLKKGLAEIGSITDSRSLAEVVARMHSYSVFPFFGGYVGADMTDSDRNVLYISQSGLGMGDRDYYTLATSGIGAFSVKTPLGVNRYANSRVELMIALPDYWKLDNESLKEGRWEWPVKIIRTMVKCIVEDSSWVHLGYGGYFGKLDESTDLSYIITMAGILPEGGDVCKLPTETPVNFFHIIPLYQSEADFYNNHTLEELLDKMADVSFVVDPNRPSAV